MAASDAEIKVRVTMPLLHRVVAVATALFLVTVMGAIAAGLWRVALAAGCR